MRSRWSRMATDRRSLAFSAYQFAIADSDESVDLLVAVEYSMGLLHPSRVIRISCVTFVRADEDAGVLDYVTGVEQDKSEEDARPHYDPGTFDTRGLLDSPGAIPDCAGAVRWGGWSEHSGCGRQWRPHGGN